MDQGDGVNVLCKKADMMCVAFLLCEITAYFL